MHTGYILYIRPNGGLGEIKPLPIRLRCGAECVATLSAQYNVWLELQTARFVAGFCFLGHWPEIKSGNSSSFPRNVNNRLYRRSRIL